MLHAAQIASQVLQNFGFRDGIPGTPYRKSVEARGAIEETLYAKIKPAIDNPELFGGRRCAVLRTYQAALDEQEAGAAPMSNECVCVHTAGTISYACSAVCPQRYSTIQAYRLDWRA